VTPLQLNILDRRLPAAKPVTVANPPKFFDFCIPLLLSGPKAEGLLQCLDERFERDCALYGVARARWMYRGSALRSLWPLLRRVVARAIKKAVVLEVIRRFFS